MSVALSAIIKRTKLLDTMGSSQVKEEKAKDIVDQSVTRTDYDSSSSVINVHGQ